jgi:hypothetical protein
MRLSVTRDNDGDSGLINLLVNDVLFLEFDIIKKKVWAHTLNNRFFMPGTLSYWTKALTNSGYDFMMVDRNILVQFPKIKRLNHVLRYAYFEYEIRYNSKKVTLAHKRYKEITAMNKQKGLEIVIT